MVSPLFLEPVSAAVLLRIAGSIGDVMRPQVNFPIWLTGGELSIYNAATYTCSTEGFVERVAIMKGAERLNMYMMFSPEAAKKEIERLRSRVTGPQYPDMEMNGFTVFKLLEEGDPDVYIPLQRAAG